MSAWLGALLSFAIALSAGFGAAVTKTSELSYPLIKALEKKLPNHKSVGDDIGKGLKDLLEELGKISTKLSSNLQGNTKKLLEHSND